jgi:N-acetylmuramoyl-L-alanine amidase
MKAPVRGSVTTVVCALGLLAAGCTPLPAIQGHAGATWHPSPNFEARRPNFVILHQTTNSTIDKALSTLTNPQRKVSAHYLISREGDILQLVDERQRAWHAGQSWWGGTTDLNSASIGIELDNTGDEEFAEPQITALLRLLTDLRARHGIPAANILGHGDIAPGRKVDPSAYFPWARLAQHGFGLWCDQPPENAPPGFDPHLGLQALGYELRNAAGARSAFRRHFLASESDAELTAAEQGLLQCLLQQKATQPR